MHSEQAASRVTTLGARRSTAATIQPAVSAPRREHSRSTTTLPIDDAVDLNLKATTTSAGRPQRRRRWSGGTATKTAMVAADLLAISLALTVATAVYRWITHDPLDDIILVSAVSLLIWPIVLAHQGLYHARHLTRRVEELRRLVNGTAVGMVLMAGISVVLDAVISRTWLVAAAVALFATVALEREIVRATIRKRRRRGRMSRRVVVIGGNEEAAELVAALTAQPELGYDVAGWVDDGPASLGSAATLEVPHLGTTADSLEILRSAGATSVIVATTGVSHETANRVVRDLTREGYYVELTSSMRDIASRRATVRPLGRYPVVCVEPVSAKGWRQVLKRLFDITFATAAVIATLPITIPAAIIIRCTAGPGVLFRQTRVGRNGQLFTVYKLRTMVHDAEALLPDLLDHNEASGPMFKMEHDPRVTPVGRFLRKTSIDELPQLFNVLRGNMSLVGPRPALPHEAVRWNDDLRERLRVKPGITGNWQVNGRFTASIEDYQRLDLYYVDNWSLVTDLVILAKTLPVVLFRNGAA